MTLQAVRAALPADSALIEFVDYQRLLPGARKDRYGSGESRYIAYMKRKGRRHPFCWASFTQSGEWANLDGQR